MRSRRAPIFKKSASVLTDDGDSANSELPAVVRYVARLYDRCVPKRRRMRRRCERAPLRLVG